MEEEYRMQKAQADIRTHSPASTPTSANGGLPKREASLPESATLASSTSASKQADADDDASTRGMASPASVSAAHSHNASTTDGLGPSPSPNGIPQIRISTESNRERVQADAETEADAEKPGDEKVANGNGNAPENGAGHAAGEALERPVQAAAGSGDSAQDGDASATSSQEPFSFSNKRLCERWLDNLFMVLYEVSLAWAFPFSSERALRNMAVGPACVDYLPRGGCALQDSARGLPQDSIGMGDPG